MSVELYRDDDDGSEMEVSTGLGGMVFASGADDNHCELVGLGRIELLRLHSQIGKWLDEDAAREAGTNP